MAGIKMTCLNCGQANRVPRDRLGSGPKCGTCGGALVTGKVAELDAATLGKAARTDELPLVVDYWAPWCGPCRAMAPEFLKAAGGLKGVARLAKIDTQANPSVSGANGIRGIPTMILYAGGRERARTSGAMGQAAILDWVNKAIAGRA